MAVKAADALVSLPYEVIESRSGFDEPVAELCADPDNPASLHTTLDAMYAYVHFPEACQPAYILDQAGVQGRAQPLVFPLGTNAAGEINCMGHLRIWTFAEATAVLTSVFGADRLDAVAKGVAHMRSTVLDQVDNLFFIYVGLLVKAGWSESDGLGWWISDNLRAESTSEVASVAARWVARWNLVSFNACVEAGFSLAELDEIVTYGSSLPDPAAVATMIALHN